MTYLHDREPELARNLPRLQLGTTPTPVRRLTRISDGPAEVWVKDEGAFGDGAWGGNKVRKLEWILPEVARRRRRSIITFGGLGTNWGLATALYGRDQGVRVVLMLVDQPRSEHVERQLDRLRASGAELHFTHTRARTLAALPGLIVRHSHRVRPPLILPPGGSSPIGLIAYVEVALEIAAQVEAGEMPEPSMIVVPLGSGGTAAGLLLGLGLTDLKTGVLGVVVSDQPRLDPSGLARRARAAARLLRKRGFPGPAPDLDPGRVTVLGEWLGAGYGHPVPDADRAVVEASESEGLVLDPVYTGKAMAALRTINAEGGLGSEPVLFLDTNGPRLAGSVQGGPDRGIRGSGPVGADPQLPGQQT
ncbi:MAG: pyridoxal-phosphate dependent enzyme [Solirubrobacterales bacterium]|nr:pyridoxal-phosphate dependent enzyme [Solirubrobacterales bacterium]